MARKLLQTSAVTIHDLKTSISRIATEHGVTHGDLQRFHNLYGDLRICVDGALLPGTETIANGTSSLKLALFGLVRVRKFRKPPARFPFEFQELSGFKYRFDWTVEQSGSLFLTILQRKRPLADWNMVEFNFDAVRAELTDIRTRVQLLLLASFPETQAEAWWNWAMPDQFTEGN